MPAARQNEECLKEQLMSFNYLISKQMTNFSGLIEYVCYITDIPQ
jgi:hypothetical protein